MKISSLILALLVSFVATGQFSTNYHPIQCSGTLPSDFVTLSSEKYQSQKTSIRKEKGSAKKVKDQFLLESSFKIDELLLSGRVVFNDPMSDYVNKVADKVLASDPETRKKLRFYILKSTNVNASTTNQGIIFINMGLLAQLENEAQLAFIISHEIIHYQKQHSVVEAVEVDKIDKGKGSYRTFSSDERQLASMTFSKEQEAEADDLGFELFKKTSYSTADLIGVFDVLKYSYLPFDDIVFDKSFLETNTYKIPGTFVLKETAPINTKDQEENPKSTHPSIKARRDLISEKITHVENNGKTNYLVSKEQFDLMRTTARFELSRLFVLHHEYEAGLYNSYMLLKKYPDNLYLKKNILECLANLASYSLSSNFEKGHVSYTEIEGKMQAVNFMFSKMDSSNRKDIIILALAYAAKLKHQYMTDQDIDAHTRFIIDLLVANDVGLNYFNDSEPMVAIVKSDTATKSLVSDANPKIGGAAKSKEEDNEENSKYAKIKSQIVEKKEVAKAGKAYYTEYALVDYYDESWVKEYFVAAQKDKNSDSKSEEIVIGKRSTVSSKVYSLALEKIVVVNPYYARLNANNKKKFKYLQSEDGQISFIKRMKICAKASKLNVEVLDSKGLGDGDVDKFNDISVLEEYVSDRLTHEDAVAPYPEREKINALAKKYNTDYFMWTGVISYKDKDKRKIVAGVMTGVFPFILPFTLSYLINGGHYTYYFNILYDVKNDKVKMVNFREVQSSTTQSILNSHIYDTFLQLHSKPVAVKKKTRR